MAGLEGLASVIFHERQQSGSALCAQHALNNLLQGNYFSAPDLSDIARNLDLLEQSYRTDPQGSNSMNMDDTGFFSVQVMENALRVWGLTLVRWRSEEMLPYHDRPQTQLAFILNLEQHWFTLRRFGKTESSVDRDQGDGHWFNLNSFLASPEWVGKLYLSMVIQQSESDGYSVFAVVQSDSTAPLALPRTDADVIAATLPEPNGALSSSPGRLPLNDREEVLSEFDEEDFELQAALQASLGHNEPNDIPGVPSFLSETENIDPVTASTERNRLMLQRMREQQELAQRQAFTYGTDGMTQEELTEQEARREARRKQEGEEEENLRKAIAESEAMARHTTSGTDISSTRTTSRAFHEDDDLQLQAALKASLEDATEAAESQDARLIEEGPAPIHNLPPSSVPDLDEIRRRRLAKFGL